MTDDQWVDLLRHVCFNYDDQGLMMYIVGRIRQEGIEIPGVAHTDVVTAVEPEPVPDEESEHEEPPAAISVIHAIDIDKGRPATNGHKVLKRTAPRSPVRKGKQRFTDEEVVELRRRHHVEHETAAALAREVGVSDESMRQMIRRDSYAYLPLEPFEPGWVDEDEARERRHQARRDAAANALSLNEKLHA